MREGKKVVGELKRKNGKLYKEVLNEKPHHLTAFEYWYSLTRSEVLEKGKGFSNCAKKLGVSRQTIVNWYYSFNWEERAQEKDRGLTGEKLGENLLEEVNKSLSDIFYVSREFLIYGAKTLRMLFKEVRLKDGKIQLKDGVEMTPKRALEFFEAGSKMILQLKQLLDPKAGVITGDINTVLIRQVAGIIDFEHLDGEQLVEVTQANFDRAKQMLLSRGIGGGDKTTLGGPEKSCGPAL